VPRHGPGEEQEVLSLVMRGFDELVHPDFSDEGIAEFIRSARSFVLERPDGHRITVAEHDERVAGMIDVRDSSHVALFFVEAGERGQGIGRALLATAMGGPCRGRAVNVEREPRATLAARARRRSHVRERPLGAGHPRADVVSSPALTTGYGMDRGAPRVPRCGRRQGRIGKPV
jgi:GNAT superfamily N-acetyltransferase